MKRFFVPVILAIGFFLGAAVCQLLPRSAEALPPKGEKTGPCQCGCISTGKCECPNCAVGCGFLPAPEKK